VPKGDIFGIRTERCIVHDAYQSLETLKKNGVDLEDPGDEIGPTSSDSPNMGLWFHDPDGYRWELSVQNGARESERALP